MEDEDKSLLEVTLDAIRYSMEGISSYLSFTYETGADFGDGWPPTLDTSLVVDQTNTDSTTQVL